LYTTIDWPMKPDRFMHLEEINEAVSKGRKLVIVGNRVVDVESFVTSHPGGMAALNAMLGKDPETTKKGYGTETYAHKSRLQYHGKSYHCFL